MTWRSIQCLRAIAAIGVLLFHFGGIGLGRAGVDLFFVISGFIMASVVRGKTPSRFLADRAWRILPLYYCAVAIDLLLVQPPLDAHRLLISATLWPVGLPYLHHSWTLSYEMLFYSCCAAFLWAGRPVLLLAPLAFFAARLVTHPIADFLGNPLILEFAGGVILAHLPRRHGTLALAATPLAFLFLAPMGLDRAFSLGIPALLLVHAGLCHEQRFAGRAFDPLMLAGASSYAIYLVHMTVGRLLPATIAWPSAAIIALLAGILFHLAVERRLLAAIRQFRNRRLHGQPSGAALAEA